MYEIQHHTNQVDVRKMAKSPHLRTPPMLATQRLISFAIKSDSSFSFVNELRKGVVPRACEV